MCIIRITHYVDCIISTRCEVHTDGRSKRIGSGRGESDREAKSGDKEGKRSRGRRGGEEEK